MTGTPNDPSEPTPPPPSPRRRSRASLLVGAALLTLAGLLCWQLLQLVRHRTTTIGDGHDLTTYGYDLANPRVAADTLVAARTSRDFVAPLVAPVHVPALDPRRDAQGDIPDLVQRQLDAAGERLFDIAAINRATRANAASRGKYLVSGGLVVGVRIGEEARAYPKRVLAWRRIVLDTLGGRPIAVIYSPHADAVVVLDLSPSAVAGRDGPIRFGNAGAASNSVDLVYEQLGGDAGATPRARLWHPLLGMPITGAAPGPTHALPRLAASIVRWDEWLALEPGSTVVLPESIGGWVSGELYQPRVPAELKLTTFDRYLMSPDLMFPVARQVPGESPVAPKARVIAVRLSRAAPADHEPTPWTLVPYAAVEAAVDGRLTLRLRLGPDDAAGTGTSIELRHSRTLTRNAQEEGVAVLVHDDPGTAGDRAGARQINAAGANGARVEVVHAMWFAWYASVRRESWTWAPADTEDSGVTE